MLGRRYDPSVSPETHWFERIDLKLSGAGGSGKLAILSSRDLAVLSWESAESSTVF